MLIKKSPSLLYALALCFVLSACGGGGSGDSDTTADNSTGDTSQDDGQPATDNPQDPVDETQPGGDESQDPVEQTPPAADDDTTTPPADETPAPAPEPAPEPEPEPEPETPVNNPPVADIQGDAEVISGATLVLDGSASSDPDGDTLSYQWTQTQGDPLSLLDTSAPTLTLIAPEVTESTLFGIQLSVSDGADTDSSEFQFTVVPPADTTPPAVATQSPQPGAVDVSTTTQVRVSFDEALDAGQLPTSSLQLLQSGIPLDGNLDYDADTRTLIFTPLAALDPGTLYSVALSDEPRDLAGNRVSPDNWQFTTGSAYNLGATSQQTMDQCMSVMDKEMLTLVNNARAVARLCGATSYPAVPPLAWNCALETAAQSHSDSMALNDFFSHTGLDGSSAGDRITAAGYIWRAYNENIAAGYTTQEQAMDAWLASDGHCANLMSPSVTEIGTGVAENPSAQYRIYWTQDLADHQ
ncbi:MAG: CAP domain-containing protein [Candidatus Thiodiazotropha sp.]